VHSRWDEESEAEGFEMQEMDMSDHFLKSGLCQWIIDFSELQIGKQVRTASFSA
jgi:hypothetical protein